MKKIYYLILGILIVLLITNPSPIDFKNHLSIESNDIFIKRKYNFFICSIYLQNGDRNYLGVLGNFFQLDDN